MHITDKDLIEAYNRAFELNVNKEFISLLKTEIQKRNLSISKKL
ncbi:MULTISPECIES: sporulation histidine kinase inhibitor Sda [Bacillaceae]|nr:MULTISPECIES: sporulation histidine kinase inhibitor Sda [Bacillaceae]